MVQRDERYTLDDRGLLVEKVGPWAKDKLKILTDYIHTSGGARSHYPGPGATYIDVFCGPVRSKIRDTNEFIDGSPVAAFKKAKGSPAPFTSIDISDANPELLKTAEKRLNALGAPVRAIPGPASSAMPQIVQRLDPSGLHLAFLESSLARAVIPAPHLRATGWAHTIPAASSRTNLEPVAPTACLVSPRVAWWYNGKKESVRG